MYDMKSELFQEQQNKRRSLPSQLTIIPNITPIVSIIYQVLNILDLFLFNIFNLKYLYVLPKITFLDLCTFLTYQILIQNNFQC